MAITKIISDLPTPPSGTDPENFPSRGDAFLLAMDSLQPEINQWASQANILRNEINQIHNDTLAQQGIISTYLEVTKQVRDKSQDYANASETSYQNTAILLNEVDIAGTGGYTVEAVDDLMSRQRNLHLVGLNLI